MDSLHRRRLVNSIAFFAGRVKWPTKVKIFKLLFLLDFRHFKETGLPVTDSDYFAWDFGPVPRELYEELEAEHIPEDLARQVRVVRDEQEDGKVSYRFLLVPNAEIDLDVFTPRQQRIMNELVEIFGPAKPREMSEITHLHNSPWDRTIHEKGKYQPIDYLLAIDDESPLPREEAKQIFEEHKEFVRNFE
jgi:uncharacterized phage-associated protein